MAEKANVFIWNPPEEETPLGCYPTIRFRLNENWPEYIDVMMTEDGILRIRGAHTLTITPDVSNVIEVRMVDPYKDQR